MDRPKEEAVIKQGQVKYKEGGLFVSLYVEKRLVYAMQLLRRADGVSFEWEELTAITCILA